MVPEVHLEVGGGARGEREAARAAQLHVQVAVPRGADRQADHELRHVHQTKLLLKNISRT